MKLVLLVVAALLQLAVGARNFTDQFQLQTSITDAVTCTSQANDGGNPTNSSTTVEYKYKYDNTQFFWAKPVGESEGCYKFTDRGDPSYANNFPVQSGAFGSANQPGNSGVTLAMQVSVGGTCSASEVVWSAQECQVLADQQLDLNISRADPVDVVSSRSLPFGCSYKQSDNSVSFNNFESFLSCSNAQPCICRRINQPPVSGFNFFAPEIDSTDFAGEQKQFEWLFRRRKLELYEINGLTSTKQNERYTQEQLTYFTAVGGWTASIGDLSTEQTLREQSPWCFGDACADSIIPSFVDFLNSRPVLDTFNQNATQNQNTIPDVSRMLYSNGIVQNFTWTGGETAPEFWRTSNAVFVQFQDASNNNVGSVSAQNFREYAKTSSSSQFLIDWSDSTRTSMTCPVGSACLYDSFDQLHFYAVPPSGALTPANQASISCPSSMTCECPGGSNPLCYGLSQNDYAGSFVWAYIRSYIHFEYRQRQADGNNPIQQLLPRTLLSDRQRLGIRSYHDPVSIDTQRELEQLAEYGTERLYQDRLDYETDKRARQKADGLFKPVSLNEKAASQRSGGAKANADKTDLTGVGFILMAIFWAISLPVSIVLYGKLK